MYAWDDNKTGKLVFTGILRYKVDFQSMQLEDVELDNFDYDDY